MSPSLPRRSSASKRTDLTVGTLAEELVAQWLMGQGWRIHQKRWRCPLGELDLIAERQKQIAFVEVKARSRGNWDADGLLAITPGKQEKLRKAAGFFLAKHPYLANFPCCFDIALVSCQRSPSTENLTAGAFSLNQPLVLPMPIQLGQPVAIGSHRLTLQQYVEGAFD
jgi:putative endonuclease